MLKIERKFESNNFTTKICQGSITNCNVIEIASPIRFTNHVVKGFSSPELFFRKISKINRFTKKMRKFSRFFLKMRF